MAVKNLKKKPATTVDALNGAASLNNGASQLPKEPVTDLVNKDPASN